MKTGPGFLKSFLFAFFLSVFLSILLARLLHYSSYVQDPRVHQFIGDFLSYQKEYTILTLAYISVYRKVLLLALPVLILFTFFSRRLFFYRAGSQWGARTWLYIVIWPIIILCHFVFDMNPFVSFTAFATIPFFVLDDMAPMSKEVPPLNMLKRWGFLLIPLSLIAFSSDIADFLAVMMLASLLVLIRKKGPALLWMDNTMLLILMIPLSQIFASILPLFVNLHGGVELGKGMAYSFCESPRDGHIYASVPRCSGILRPEDIVEKKICNEGFIAEYDRNSNLIENHHLFTDNFYGRLEHIECLDDTIVASMTKLVARGNFYEANAIEVFPRINAARMFFDTVNIFL